MKFIHAVLSGRHVRKSASLVCPRYENFDWKAEWPEADEWNQLSTEEKRRIWKEDEELICQQWGLHRIPPPGKKHINQIVKTFSTTA